MKFTREGKRFVLATILLTFAAFNTGNNLIYLVLSLMLSIIAIAVVALLINMRGLALEVNIDGPVFVGQEANLELSVTNRKRLIPSFSIKFIMPEGIKGQGIVTEIAPMSTAKIDCLASFDRRGIFKWGDFKLESGFPFIFLTRMITVSVEGMITVYPKIIEVAEIGALSGEGRSTYSIRPGRGEDLLTIREFRDGDDVKIVNWKATAKAQRLMVKELAEEQPLAVKIILDDLAPFDASAFEKSVSYAASLALRLIEDGYYVGLVTSVKRLPYGSGQEQLYRILDVLAVARETEDALNYYEDDSSGMSVLVLKSKTSMFRETEADRVIYAS